MAAKEARGMGSDSLGARRRKISEGVDGCDGGEERRHDRSRKIRRGNKKEEGQRKHLKQESGVTKEDQIKKVPVKRN